MNSFVNIDFTSFFVVLGDRSDDSMDTTNLEQSNKKMKIV